MLQNYNSGTPSGMNFVVGVFADNLRFCPGACGFVVRRHVRHRAAGPHPVLREAEQSGQRLHSPQAPGDRKLTVFDFSSQL